MITALLPRIQIYKIKNHNYFLFLVIANLRTFTEKQINYVKYF
jgi:hypothetical protein